MPGEMAEAGGTGGRPHPALSTTIASPPQVCAAPDRPSAAPPHPLVWPEVRATVGGVSEAKEELETTGRRKFLQRIVLALGGVMTAILGVPIVGVLVSPVRRASREEWKPVGALDDFPLGRTIKVTYPVPDSKPWAGPVGNSAAYLRRVGEAAFMAFSIHCTHTGCPVHWVEGAKMFLCPCHGGAFDQNGHVVAGPPPRPLAMLDVRVREGVVEVLTRRVPFGAVEPDRVSPARQPNLGDERR
jgi:menaquinol-cytochrome c reductase iron-sulfur subunit